MSTESTDHRPNPGWNPSDPHGIHHDLASHEHHVTPAIVNRVVLAVLLVFTVLTVFLSQAEKSLATTLAIEIPQWVNVAIAMSIALVKGTLVVLYFMHIKYDNKLNAIVLISCILATMMFIGTTMLDLGQRNTIYNFKTAQIIPGGTQVGVASSAYDQALELSKFRGNTAIVEYAKRRYIRDQGLRQHILATVPGQTPQSVAALDLPRWIAGRPTGSPPLDWDSIDALGLPIWERENHKAHAKHAGHGDDHGHGEHSASTANASRPRTGITPGLFGKDGHGGDGSHGGH